MTPIRRWCIVAVGVALVIGTPLALRAAPAKDREVSAAALLASVERSSSHPYSGYVETLGTLELPVADRFTDVGALFGERTRMRVWWRSPDAWRVDKVLATGETDLVHDRDGTTLWDYEKNDVTRSRDPDIRLPQTADLLPTELARRLLTDVDTSELSRLAPRHVAGRDALGLRLSPHAPQSSIDHVDLWAEPGTGIPLRVEVYAKSASFKAAFTSEFMNFSTATPATDMVSFETPAGADVSYDDVLDVADAANQYAPIAPPSRLAGLTQSPTASLRAVGVYGKGVTQLIAIPLWDHAAEPLRAQLEKTPGVKLIQEGDILQVGPLSVLLTQFDRYGGGWLITGTVTQDTVISAARQLDQHARLIDR